MSNATKWTPKVGDRIERVGSPSILPAPGTLGVVVDVKGKASNGIRARWDGSTSDVGTITNTRRSRPAEPAIGDVVRSRISERYGVVTGIECAAGMKTLTVTQAGGRGRVCDAAVCDIVERPSSVDRARVIDGVAIGDRVQGRGTGRLGVVIGFAGTSVVPLLRVAFEASPKVAPANREHLETASRGDVERIAGDRRRVGVKVDELLTSPIGSANPAAFAVINPPVEPAFKPGDRVQTAAGAKFRGTVIGVYGDEIRVELDVDEHLGEWTSFHHRALEPETEPLFELGERVRLRHADRGAGTVVGLDEYPEWTRVEWDDGRGGVNVKTTALLRSSKPKAVSSDRVETIKGFAAGDRVVGRHSGRTGAVEQLRRSNGGAVVRVAWDLQSGGTTQDFDALHVTLCIRHDEPRTLQARIHDSLNEMLDDRTLYGVGKPRELKGILDAGVVGAPLAGMPISRSLADIVAPRRPGSTGVSPLAAAFARSVYGPPARPSLDGLLASLGGSSPAQVAIGNAARRCSVPDLVDDESVTHETVAGRRFEITIRRVEG